jgi:hypothetical protein
MYAMVKEELEMRVGAISSTTWVEQKIQAGR